MLNQSCSRLFLVVLLSIVLSNCASLLNGGQDGSEEEIATEELVPNGFDPNFDPENPTRDAPALDYQLDTYGQVIYINPDANDPAEDGTIDHPFNSWKDLPDKNWNGGPILASDTAYLQYRGTTWNGTITTEIEGGGDRNHVLIGMYGPQELERPTIVGALDSDYIVGLHDCTECTLADFVVKHTQHECVEMDGRIGDILVYNIETEDCADGIWSTPGPSVGRRNNVRVLYAEIHDCIEGIFMGSIDNLEIGYSYIYDVNRGWTPGCDEGTCPGDAIQLGGGMENPHIHHNTVDKGLLTPVGNKFGLIINHKGNGGSGAVIEYNTFYGPIPEGDGGAGIYLKDGSNYTFRYNRLLGPMISGIWSDVDGLHIYGNIFKDLSEGIVTQTNDTIYNNLFTEVEGTMIMKYNPGEVFNNIFDNREGALVCSSCPDSGYNLFTKDTGSLGSTDVLSEFDLLFVNSEQDDYRLQVESPAIDMGTDVGLSKDAAGVSITQGLAPDIGPFEFQ